jgi:hypothetical protein
MVVFPLVSIAVDASIRHAHRDLLLIGKWFVFWAVGVRLLLAGLRQVVQPQYTAKTILGIEGNGALLVIRELGFANAAIGAVGIMSILITGWAVAGGFAGGILYGLVGANHAMQVHRNRLQSLAMASDLFAAAVLLTYCTWVALK